VTNLQRETLIELPPDEMRIRFARDETIWFVSSSGHCNLDCTYCVVQPIAKHKPSLTLQDLKFLLQQTPERALFIFSGIGDFFAGYKRDERLLAALLGDPRTGGVALDINGVVIHCFEDLSAAQLAEVRHVNLTFHYRQLRDHEALPRWQTNALTLLAKADGPDFFVNTILSPPRIGALGRRLELVSHKRLCAVSEEDHPHCRCEPAV